MTAQTPDIYAPQFTDEAAAIACVEASRWPNEVNCPLCGSVKVHRMKGETQAGYFLCNDCRDKFTCRTKTVMERSHIPVRKWLLAIHLMSASKKGMSAHQLHRMLGITYKSAWFLAHRIREAMKDGNPSPLGGEGKTVQADETYYGNSSKRAKGYRKGHRHKEQVVALVEPKGRVRAVHVKKATAETVREILVTNVRRTSELHTDESNLYVEVGREFAAHKTVQHGWNQSGHYVGKDGQTTNAAENFFGIFKRGMVGTYHKCEAQHLARYLAEFEFRFNHRVGLGVNDKMRAQALLKGIEGKRLQYRISH
ncbi:MAG: IS1595 family transposase [Xanthobacteraceae bacterium]|jgi:transposase-like protein